MLYVGVDAHKAHSQMTVIDETGTVLERRRTASSREGMLEALGPHRGELMKGVLEAGYGWGPIYDWIGEAAEEVVLAPTPYKGQGHRRRQDKDRQARLGDAGPPIARGPHPRGLRLLQGGEGQKAGVEAEDVPGASAHDGQEPREGAPLPARRGASSGERPPVRQEGSGVAQGRARALPEPDGWLLREEVELAETLKEKIRATEGLIKELAEGDKAVGWLRSLPGVGEFFSVLIRHEVGEMERFPRALRNSPLTPEWSPLPLRLGQEDDPREAHQGGQQVAEVGVHRGGEPRDPLLGVPARLLPEDQGQARGEGREDRDRQEAGGVGLDGVDGAP
jgi:hypothetical protein